MCCVLDVGMIGNLNCQSGNDLGINKNISAPCWRRIAGTSAHWVALAHHVALPLPSTLIQASPSPPQVALRPPPVARPGLVAES